MLQVPYLAGVQTRDLEDAQTIEGAYLETIRLHWRSLSDAKNPSRRLSTPGGYTEVPFEPIIVVLRIAAAMCRRVRTIT